MNGDIWSGVEVNVNQKMKYNSTAMLLREII